MKNIVIFISGRGSNMEAILKSIESGQLKGLCRVKAVFSNMLSAAGLQTAVDYSVPIFCINSKNMDKVSYNEKLTTLMKDLNPDYIILAGYMKILVPEFVRAFKGKIINIHPADTSKHQGLHAYDWAFENGLNKTYITVHYVDEGVDTGEVIGKQEVDLVGAGTLEEVEKRGLKVEHCFYSEMLKKVFSG